MKKSARACPFQRAIQPKRLVLREQGFKGSLHLGTIPVYVITLGFTLCFIMAV